ncbi:MAG: FG-GAP repeat protein, partial [Planctomycetes bacterium]|nr:FG-GAP repeat protein [Planctomycetota bacterium]
MTVGDGTPADGSIYLNANADDFGVNIDASGNLFGFGWAENIGWVNFDTSGLGSARARFDAAGGRFRGWAWGENVGWINLDDTVHFVATTQDCGDGDCSAGEDSCNCADDCGDPDDFEVPGLTCDDDLDNDCDTLTDCADPDCQPCCGDGNCDPGEDACSCPNDCGGEPSVEDTEVKLTALDAFAGDSFGFSVSISADTAIVGAWLRDDAGDASGAA